jgi:hypothetical protein
MSRMRVGLTRCLGSSEMEITRHEGSALQLRSDRRFLETGDTPSYVFEVPHPISSLSLESTRPRVVSERLEAAGVQDGAMSPVCG